MVIENENTILLKKKINEIDENIKKLNENIKQLQDEKNIMCQKKCEFQKELQKTCVHEFIDHRNFDGHRTYSTYSCTLCKFESNCEGDYKIVKRVYEY